MLRMASLLSFTLLKSRALAGIVKAGVRPRSMAVSMTVQLTVGLQLVQVKARPPSFVAFVSGAKELSEASKRFLLNLVRKEFGFGGVPMRLTVRYNKRRK